MGLRDSFVWGDYNQRRSFDIETGDKAVAYKWLPTASQNRHNRRSWYLVEQLGLDKTVALDFLRKFWDILVGPKLALLERCSPGYGLNGDLIRLSNGELQPQYVCQSCGLMQQHAVEGQVHCISLPRRIGRAVYG